LTDFVVTNAQLLDPAAGELRPGASIRVERDRIVEVGEEGTLVSPPENAVVFDAGGRTLMPGLIDAHVHAAITTMDLAAMARRSPTRVGIEAKAVRRRSGRRSKRPPPVGPTPSPTPTSPSRSCGPCERASGRSSTATSSTPNRPRSWRSTTATWCRPSSSTTRSPRSADSSTSRRRAWPSSTPSSAQGFAAIETAVAAGVELGFGTDLLGETHDAQAREFTLRAKMQTAAEVIRSATTVNAALLGRPGELGLIAPGAYADVLLLDGRPAGRPRPPHRPRRAP
jgi:cytosine/adenosine deaminase-related metal-dependent hydrolase